MSSDTPNDRPRVRPAIFWTLLAASFALGALAVLMGGRNERDEGVGAWFRVGLDHYAAGRWVEGAQVFESLMDRTGPVADAARLNAGLCLYQDGKFAEARTFFQSVVACEEFLLRVQSQFNAGNCDYRLGDWKGASAFYQGTIRQADAMLVVLSKHRHRSDTDASVRLLKELRQRAVQNLALTRQAASQPAEAPPPASPQSPSLEEGTPALPDGKPAEAKPSDGASSGNSTAAGGSGAAKSADQVLQGALSRDAGPQVSKDGLRASPGERDY